MNQDEQPIYPELHNWDSLSDRARHSFIREALVNDVLTEDEPIHAVTEVKSQTADLFEKAEEAAHNDDFSGVWYIVDRHDDSISVVARANVDWLDKTDGTVTPYRLVYKVSATIVDDGAYVSAEMTRVMIQDES